MKWLRSEIMEYISLIVNEDAAHDCIQKLGDLGVIQFTDLNPELTPFQRRYVSYIKRCDEMERKLRYMENEIIKLHLPIKSAGTIDNFIMGSSNLAYGSNDTALRVLDTLERILEDKELELRQLNQMHERLAGDYNEKKELQEVINKMNELFTIDLPDVSTSASSNMSMIDIRNSEHQQSAASLNQQLNEINKKNDLLRDDNILRFRYLTGVVPTEERLKFERVIFRTTRGNVYMRFSPIKELIIDPITGQSIAKDAFVLFFQTEYLENKLRKICEAFHSHLYTIPSFEDRTAISSLLQNVSVELTQSKQILRKNRESTMLLCMELSEHLQAWKWTILQEKGIYHILNMFRADVTGMLRGEGWVVEAALNDVKMQVERSHHTNDHVMPSLVDLVPRPWPTPPTYFYTNKFTDSYQNFVDTYGTPRYREINPAVFTAVTFPFLFGVMYGDIGHGICLFLAGLYMVLTEKKLENAANMNEMLVSVYNGRYMILMMGIFAIYAGFVYNDFFCLPLNIFGSKYKFPHSCLDEDGLIRTGCEAEYLNGPMNTTDVSNGENVYVFGMDPIWKVSDNELLFFNSFKMKLSVIIGITQMVFGIILRGWNALYFRHYSDFLFEFLPQIIFSCALFVYMVVLIIIKWSINWLERMNPASHCKEFCHPPSLINTLINILLDPTHVEDPMYPNQLATQQTLLTFALLSVPVLLFGKPVYLKIVSMCKPRHENEEPLEFGEIFIHQSIETIEFVLGMVSNTASYLRLWALSLAHAELAQVFWEKAMLSQINSNNFFMVFIGFAIFAGVTTGVLLMMDVLECFLHALRLHWVEFQNKFYKADGLRFEPFSFKDILKGGNL